jgi:hypothetical protein
MPDGPIYVDETLPPTVARAMDAARAAGFTMSCEPAVG